MVTLRQIAEEAKVSISTVSFVLNGRAEDIGISPSRVEQVRRIAEKRGYRPNSNARAMRLQQSNQIGALLANTADRPFHGPSTFETLIGVNLELELHRYVTTLIHISDTAGENPRAFREHLVDGIIVFDTLPATLVGRVEQLMHRCVWIENAVWREQGCIRRDEQFCASALVKHCLDAGYTRVVWFVWKPGVFVHYSHVERTQAVTTVCRDRGIPLETLHFERANREAIAQKLAAVLTPSTLVIAYDVPLARLFALLALEGGRRIGADYGLACCDDSHEVQNDWQSLTRVTFDRIELGRRAARMMLGIIAEPDADHPSQSIRGEVVPGSTAQGPSKTSGRGRSKKSPTRSA